MEREMLKRLISSLDGLRQAGFTTDDADRRCRTGYIGVDALSNYNKLEWVLLGKHMQDVAKLSGHLLQIVFSSISMLPTCFTNVTYLYVFYCKSAFWDYCKTFMWVSHMFSPDSDVVLLLFNMLQARLFFIVITFAFVEIIGDFRCK